VNWLFLLLYRADPPQSKTWISNAVMSGNLQFLWETELVSNPVAKKLHAIVAESLNSSNSKVVFVLQNIVLNQGVLRPGNPAA